MDGKRCSGYRKREKPGVLNFYCFRKRVFKIDLLSTLLLFFVCRRGLGIDRKKCHSRCFSGNFGVTNFLIRRLNVKQIPEKMKRALILLAAILFLFSSCDYDPGISEAFAKYRFKEGVTTITVPGWVIGLAARYGDLEKSEREILECIDKVRVLVVENEDLNARINLNEEFNRKINMKNDFEELMSVHNQQDDVTIFGKTDGEVMTEMVILVGGDDNALIYIRGEIKPELLNDKINLSQTDRLLSLKF